MTVCQICGDNGYSKLLTLCVQCQNIAAHRYCILGPSIFRDEKVNWYCEDCDPGKIEPTTHSRMGECLSSTVEPRALRETVQRKNRRNNSCRRQSKKPNFSLKETTKGVTDGSILGQKNKVGNVEKEQAGALIVCGLSVPTSYQESKRGVNMGCLLSKVVDCVDETTCSPGDGIQEVSKVLKKQKLAGLVPKKGKLGDKNPFKGKDYGALSLDKSPSKELHINNNQTREAELDGHIIKTQPGFAKLDHSGSKNSGVEDTTAEVQSNTGVCEHKAPRKKRKFIIEMEYSDEEPVFVVAKHPQLGKDLLNRTTSEARSELRDDSPVQLSCMEYVPPRPSPMKVDDRLLTTESSMMFDCHIPARPPPLNPSLMFDHHIPVQPSVNLYHDFPALPLPDACWSGYCIIDGIEGPMSLLLGAHLSTKANEKVHGAVRTLPELLNFNFVPKKYVWPKKFEKSSPAAHEIALYFFPIDEGSERLYEDLVDKLFEHDLALKALINSLELLIFCSLELPRDERSFRRKYYLWSVFKLNKDPNMLNTTSNIHHTSNVQLPRDAFCEQKDPGSVISSRTDPSNTNFHQEAGGGKSVDLTADIRSNADSFSAHFPAAEREPAEFTAHISSNAGSSNTHVRQEARRESFESTRPISRQLHHQAYDKQGNLDHERWNRNSNVRCRKGDKPSSRDTGRPQHHEHRRDTESSDYAKHIDNYQERSDRWKRHSGKWKGRNWMNSGYSHKSYRSDAY